MRDSPKHLRRPAHDRVLRRLVSIILLGPYHHFALERAYDL